MIKSASILLKNNFLKKFSIWSLFPALTPYMAQKKLLHPRSWSECNVFPASSAIYVTDIGTQTVNITCDHEEENNRRVMNELKVLSQHLLDYNKRTFEKFM